MIKNGIDIVKISKIQDMLNKGDGLAEMILTNDEKEYFYSKKPKVKREGEYSKEVQTIAGFFACKEAVLKAFGIGILDGVNFKEIEITHTPAGEPICNFYGKMKERFETLAVKSCAISISHDGEYAIAMCSFEI